MNVLKFNGIDSYIVLADATQAQQVAPREFTVEAWIKQAVHHPWTALVGIVEDEGESEKGWMLGIPFGRKWAFTLASVEGKKGFTHLRDSAKCSLHQWRHLAGTYDGQTMNFYVDGVLRGTSSAQSGNILYPETGELLIGAYQDSDELYPFCGSIAEVRLWNQARTLTDIVDTTMVRLNPTECEGLIGYWPLHQEQNGLVDNWANPEQLGTVQGTVVMEEDPDLILGGYSPAPPAPQMLDAEQI